VDLFDQEDKRLSLKPVKEFADLVRNAFADGQCGCILCINGGAGPAAGQAQHTYEIDGAIVSRRFAISTFADVRGGLAKAWESYYKTELPEQGPVDVDAIGILVGDEARPTLLVLLGAAGVVKEVEDGLHFVACP